MPATQGAKIRVVIFGVWQESFFEIVHGMSNEQLSVESVTLDFKIGHSPSCGVQCQCSRLSY
jgi:hypothetical protein